MSAFEVIAEEKAKTWAWCGGGEQGKVPTTGRPTLSCAPPSRIRFSAGRCLSSYPAYFAPAAPLLRTPFLTSEAPKFLLGQPSLRTNDAAYRNETQSWPLRRAVNTPAPSRGRASSPWQRREAPVRTPALRTAHPQPRAFHQWASKDLVDVNPAIS